METEGSLVCNCTEILFRENKMHPSQQFEKNIQIKLKTIFSDILDNLARSFDEKLKLQS